MHSGAVLAAPPFLRSPVRSLTSSLVAARAMSQAIRCLPAVTLSSAWSAEQHDGYQHQQPSLKAKPALGIGNIAPGDRAAAESAVRPTFFGKVDRVRWTNFIMDSAQDPQVVSIAGEATHHNEIWQSFQVELAREGSTWKMRKVRAMPPAWFD